MVTADGPVPGDDEMADLRRAFSVLFACRSLDAGSLTAAQCSDLLAKVLLEQTTAYDGLAGVAVLLSAMSAATFAALEEAAPGEADEVLRRIAHAVAGYRQEDDE